MRVPGLRRSRQLLSELRQSAIQWWRELVAGEVPEGPGDAPGSAFAPRCGSRALALPCFCAHQAIDPLSPWIFRPMDFSAHGFFREHDSCFPACRDLLDLS
jgi:hypothetical protein